MRMFNKVSISTNISIFVLLSVVAVIIGLLLFHPAGFRKVFSSFEETIAKKQDSIVYVVDNFPYELSLVKDDINMYEYLSPAVREEIINSLDVSHKRFKVPIGLMHAVTRTESEYRFWITHPTVTTRIYGKMVSTNALGMGGIIWEIWGDTLKYFNVAYNKSDLYLPGVGITAQACVLYLIIQEVMRNNTSVNNIVERVQTKYYGAYASEYIARMKLVTSDLWLKRIAREIEYTYSKNDSIASLGSIIPSDSSIIEYKQ